MRGKSRAETKEQSRAEKNGEERAEAELTRAGCCKRLTWRLESVPAATCAGAAVGGGERHAGPGHLAGVSGRGGWLPGWRVDAMGRRAADAECECHMSTGGQRGV